MNSKNKRALIALCSGVALVIGIAAIVVPLVAGAGTTTSADTLDIVQRAPADSADGVSPYANAPVIGSIMYPIVSTDPMNSNFWRVPVDAPFSTMPEGQMCDPAQMAWLAEHAEPGRPVGLPVEAQVRNSADTGASMSIGNIHADGELVPNSQVVTLQCGGIGGGGSQIILLALDGSPGVWGAPSGWEENPQPEGAVATLNLAPGEIAELTFVIAESTKRFKGRIVADVASPEAGTVVLVDDLDFPSLPMPGFYLSFANGWFECSRPGSGSTPCTFAEAEELLREAGRS